jgi:chemotaxis protein CheD
VARVVIGMADCGVAAEAESLLVTYALGSCIGLALYDPVAGVGGLLHFMLPDSTQFPGKVQENPYRFADTGIPLLLERVCAQGALRRRLIVYMAGGAQILDSEGVFEIGKRNCLAARRLLWKYGLLLAGEAVGGADFRTVTLEIATGRFVMEEGGRHRELMSPVRKKGESTWRTVS